MKNWLACILIIILPISNAFTQKLHDAVKTGDLTAVQKVVRKGVSINETDREGYTALHIAFREGYTEIVKLLISKGADLNAVDREGCTVLQIAAREGNTDIGRLIIDNGAEVNSVEVFGNTPLHFAAMNGNTQFVDLLLEKGANVDAMNIYGQKSADLADSARHDDVVKILSIASEYHNSANQFQYFLNCCQTGKVIPRYIINKYSGLEFPLEAGEEKCLEVIPINQNITGIIYELSNYMGSQFYLTSHNHSGELISRVEFGTEGGDIARYQSTGYQVNQEKIIIVQKIIEIYPDTEGEEVTLTYYYYRIGEAGDIIKVEDTDHDPYQRKYWIASVKELIDENLLDFTKEELRIMRNEIFAAHGYIFKTEEMKKYFSGKKWYVPAYDNVDERLTDIEKKNIELIREFEKGKTLRKDN